MEETVLRGNAMLAEVSWQRDQYANRCALLAADLAQARSKIELLEKDDKTLKVVKDQSSG